MVRRYRRALRSNKDKYSVEHAFGITPSTGWAEIQAPSDSYQTTWNSVLNVVPSTELQGMRKVKHFTLSFSNRDSAEEINGLMVYALVYVPAGYQAQPIILPAQGTTVGLYDGNQFVLSTGVLDFSGGPLRIRCPLSRNLNSGDSIQLILATTTNGGTQINFNVSFAITLQ